MITDDDLKAAMMADFQQHMINSVTPHRSYPFPIEAVRALLDSNLPDMDRCSKLAAEARELLFNGCDSPKANLSQLWKIDAILREIAGIPKP